MGGMDSVKLFLIVSAVLLVFALGFYFYQDWDLGRLKQDVGYCFGRTLPEVGEVSYSVTLKNNELEKDKMRGLQIHDYLEQRANEANINANLLKMSRIKESPNNREGYLDSELEVTPSGKRGKQKFGRRNIAQFIFLLENYTNSLKVTSLTLDDPSEDHEQWTMRLDITERKPLK